MLVATEIYLTISLGLISPCFSLALPLPGLLPGIELLSGIPLLNWADSINYVFSRRSLVLVPYLCNC